MTGLYITPGADVGGRVDALVRRLGARVPLTDLLDDLDRRVRRTPAPGRAVQRAWAFDLADQRDARWWPQGVTWSDVAGRRVMATSWYAKKRPGEDAGQGSRVTFLDLERRRYAHVLLLMPGREGAVPLRVHAGGLVWAGDHLHVAATARGFYTARLDDLTRVKDPSTTYGYRYVLPVRVAYRAGAEEGTERLRYSFFTLDRAASPPELLVGEYGRGRATTRLVRFALEPDTLLPQLDAQGVARPIGVEDGVRQMQGVVRVRGRLLLSVSQGPWTRGSLYAGEPTALGRHRFALPMGVEDLSYVPDDDLVWSVSEHPYRRWLVALRPTSGG